MTPQPRHSDPDESPITDESLIAGLRRQIDAVLGHRIREGTRCALVDYPNHANVGDSAIWLGEIDFLSRRKASLVYVCDKETYRRSHLAECLGSDGLILLHGGGNLGDLWIDHQELRERVVSDFPNHEIIQFPQTIYFRQAANVDRCRRVFDRHARLTLLCRDEPSLEFARREFRATAELCPDMAFSLHSLPARLQPCREVLWLARTDEESRGASIPELPPAVEVVDWLEEQTTPTCERNWALVGSLWKEPDAWGQLIGPLMDNFDALARERLRRGCDLLSRGKGVITDRLHGHILCLLLRIPHVLIDNSYGKLDGFYHTWTRPSRLARWAFSPSEALALALELS